MDLCEVMWELFRRTGHIGAYLLYRDYSAGLTPAAATREQPHGVSERGMSSAVGSRREVDVRGPLSLLEKRGRHGAL